MIFDAISLQKSQEIPYVGRRIAWSPDSQRIASFHSGMSQLNERTRYSEFGVWEIASNKLTQKAIESSEGSNGFYPRASPVAWSQDGKRIIAAGAGRMSVWEFPNTIVIHLLYTDYHDSDISLSSDEQRIVASNGILLNLNDPTDWTFLGLKRSKAAWSSDGTKIAFASPEELRILTAESMKVNWYLDSYPEERWGCSR